MNEEEKWKGDGGGGGDGGSGVRGGCGGRMVGTAAVAARSGLGGNIDFLRFSAQECHDARMARNCERDKSSVVARDSENMK